MITTKHIAMILLGLTSFHTLAAETGPAPAAETPAQREARMAWFNEARFGMFIHWGVYAVPAGEWKGKRAWPDKPASVCGEWIMENAGIPVSEYEPLAQQFNPVRFDAREWVSLARNAGMKYIVITTKHHDGFALWPTDLSSWSIRSTPFQRDPLQELAAECRKAGIKLCFYHSIMDWHHPDWPERRAWNDKASGTPDMERYVAYLKGQLAELLTRYGPVGIMWFDGEWEKPWTHERGVDLYRYLRQLQPDIIVNNRIGKGRTGMSGMDQGQGVGDYGTPEQEIPVTGFGPGLAWESCMTMNDTWGYRKDDQNWKPAAALVRNLIDCASKGGNFLLNVGPTAEGVFPEASIERLRKIADWMKVNGEAIHGTTASPFPAQLPWGRCTRKGDQLYLHVYDWPADGRLHVPLTNPKVKARLLAQPGSKLKCVTQADGLVIELPPQAPDAMASVVALQVNGTPAFVSPNHGSKAQ
jgi:alpha-L-fucosidase